MATTCYLADQADTTIKLWDFVDSAGTFNPGSVKSRLVGIDAGSYTPDMGLFDPDTGDGSLRTKRRAPSVAMTLQLRTSATNQDNHRIGVGRLFSLLEVPRILVYKGDGMAETRYVYLLGSSVDQLLTGGQANWDLIVRQFEDVQMDLSLVRQPIILGDPIASGANVLSNAALLYDQDGANGTTTGRPDAYTWRTTAGAVDATGISAETCSGQTDGYAFTLGAGLTKDLTQDAGVATIGDVWSAQFVFLAATAASITATAVIQFLNGAALVGTETLGASLTGTGVERGLTVTSAAAPATTTTVRIKLRLANGSGAGQAITLRRAQLEKAAAASRFRVGSESVPNDPAVSRGRVAAFWNDGDARAPVQVTTTADAGATIGALVTGKRGNGGVAGLRFLGDYANVTKYLQAETSERGWTVTYGANTSNPGGGPDADASGTTLNNLARITHATAPTVSVRRIRATRTTNLDSLRGAMRVIARVRPAVSDQYFLRLKWSASTADPASNSETEVLLDTQARGAAPPVNGFVELDLGTIYLPTSGNATLGGVAIEIWTRSGLINSNLDVDQIWFVPAETDYDDSNGTVYIQGSSTEKVVGKNLTTPPFRVNPPDPIWIAAGTFQSNMRLNAVNKACGWGPLVGTALGLGRHRFTFQLVDNILGSHTVRIRVANVTANIPVPGADTIYTVASKKLPTRHVLEFDGAAATNYQAEIGITAYGTSGQIDVQSITYDFLATVSVGQKMRSNPDTYTTQRLDASGNLLDQLQAAGELPILADPGLTIMAIRHDEIPLQLYNERQNKKARSPVIDTLYRPGFYQL